MISTAAKLAELALCLFGAYLLWSRALRPSARRAKPPANLAPWRIGFAPALVLLVLGVSGALIGIWACISCVRGTRVPGTTQFFLMNIAGQIGALGGFALFRLARPSQASEALQPLASYPVARAMRTGFLTFIALLPCALLASAAGQLILHGAHMPTAPQGLVSMFLELKSPLMIATGIVFTVVGAPALEETVFRAGVYRYLRTRIGGTGALTVSSLLFAAAHVDWANHADIPSFLPSFILGAGLALSYQRTGSLVTPIAAHALFNLNTAILVLAGL